MIEITLIRNKMETSSIAEDFCFVHLEKKDISSNPDPEFSFFLDEYEYSQALPPPGKSEENLRKEISKDPKSVVERELGIKFAAEVQVKVIDVTEENTVYYVLPHHPSQKLGTEFSDEQLDAIAGGIGFTDVTGMLGQGASALIGGAENLVGKTLGIAGSAISGIGSTVSGIGKKI